MKPIFEVYEDDIDKSVEKYSGKFWAFVLRQFKSLLWHMAFSEEDGIVAGTMAFLGQAHRVPDLLKGWGVENSPKTSVSAVNFGKQKVLSDFLDMMREELVLRAGYSDSALKLCTMSVKENPNFLLLRGVLANGEKAQPHYFSFARFSSLSQDETDANTIVLYNSPAIHGIWKKQEGRIYLRLNGGGEGGSEREGLMFGLEIAIMHSRGLLSKGLENLFRIKVRQSESERAAKEAVFEKFRNFCRK